MHVAPKAVQDSQSSLSARFTAAHRLLRQHGFDHVVHAENIAEGRFRVFFVRNGEKNARLGIIVGKRTLPGAVDRNRAKRIIREVFRQHGVRLCNLDMVVMVRHADYRGDDTQVGNLKMLFSRIENRCAES